MGDRRDSSKPHFIEIIMRDMNDQNVSELVAE